jgi:6-phosphogluconolactonase
MKNLNSYLFIILIVSLAFGCEPKQKKETEPVIYQYAYIGTYTRAEGHVDGKAKGIYALTLDQDAQIISKQTVAELINPSFLHVDRENGWLYAVSETGPEDGPSGWLYSYKLLPEGELSLMDSAETNGHAPCHVVANKDGDRLFVANYIGGTVNVYDVKEGRLNKRQTIRLAGQGTHPRQEASHTHMVALSPDERYVFVTDLGSNKIWNFKVDSTGELQENPSQSFVEMDAEAGPRHMTFHPNGKWAFVINELSSTITSLSYNSEGGQLLALSTVSTMDSSDEIDFNLTADIHVHPNGKYLYGSNRGANTISAFRVNDDGSLQSIQQISTQGDFPRNFAVNKSGTELWVANQNTDNILIYQIDQTTGMLKEDRLVDEIMTPVCISLP